MSRRELPARSTRGQKPVITEEQANQDNQIYEKLFGNNLDDDEDYEEKKRLEEQRKNMMVLNIQDYCYSRGYHYFFPLDKFERLQGHPSYASDADNVFHSTYRKEDKQYVRSKLSELINRKYIGLPRRSQEKHENKQGLCKNICHSYLFENEDKKYHLTRNIHTLKKVHENLDNLIANGKLSQFKLLRTDFDLKLLFTRESSFEEKREALRKRITILEERRDSLAASWYNLDKAFFHYSLKQTLHNDIAQLKEQMSGRQIISMLLGNYFFLKTIIERGNSNLIPFLKNAFLYYNSDKLVIDQQSIEALQEKAEHLIKVDSKGEPIFLFPAQVFSFGSSQLMELVNRILAVRIFKMSEATYYLAKFTWKRLFQSDLTLPKKGQQRGLSAEEYLAFAQKVIDDARQAWNNIPREVKQRGQNQYPTLNELINFDQITAPTGDSKILTLKKTGELPIQVKDFVIITLYDWVCQGFNAIFPLIRGNQQFQEIMYSDSFPKFIHQIVSIVELPIVGTLTTAIEMLCDCLSRPSPFEELDIALNFQLAADKKVGIVWKVEKESQVWETDSEQDVEDEDEEVDDENDEADEDDGLNGEGVKQNKNESVPEDEDSQSQGSSPNKKQKM